LPRFFITPRLVGHAAGDSGDGVPGFGKNGLEDGLNGGHFHGIFGANRDYGCHAGNYNERPSKRQKDSAAYQLIIDKWTM
jgi:hypothetical protein